MTVNGKYQENINPITVMDFIRGYKLNKYVVYIAINEIVIEMEDYETTKIFDKDFVEFLFTVSGG